MEIRSKPINKESVVLHVFGRFTLEDVRDYESEFEHAARGARYVALNLSGLDYIDSSGIGSLIKTMNITKNANAEFILFDVNPTILHIFKIAYLDKFFIILSKQDLVSKYPQFK
jgi:anti-sigma B factor antagonist